MHAGTISVPICPYCVYICMYIFVRINLFQLEIRKHSKSLRGQLWFAIPRYQIMIKSYIIKYILMEHLCMTGILSELSSIKMLCLVSCKIKRRFQRKWLLSVLNSIYHVPFASWRDLDSRKTPDFGKSKYCQHPPRQRKTDVVEA